MVSPSMDFNPLDQQLNDPPLLRWKEFVPERAEFGKRCADLLFGNTAIVFVSLLPCAHNNLGCANDRSHLIDDRSLDLRGRHPSDRTCLGTTFDHAGGDVIAI